ncbi:hypothetical protein [Oceanidesulfovibrio marinus]|uniref:SprA-related family protein n=1 Tax=Oceanidesulfovibrio marinus TaxID=370038 RepID=A0ABX6NJW1_9BACT|nr:hypothetical protein [Oceanidesulfovibrio marinus]QJT10935.1 hypothetical protein E8L03_19355 [Oceanidesulfovibrio marinus]
MNVASSSAYGAGTTIRGIRAYARQSPRFGAFGRNDSVSTTGDAARLGTALATTADESSASASASSTPHTEPSPRSRSIGFRIGPFAIRYTTEEPDVAPGVSWDDLVREAERLASVNTSAPYEAEHEVAELRSSLAESPVERLTRRMGESATEQPGQSLSALDAGAAPPAAMRKAAAAYADTASLSHRPQTGGVWHSVL